MRGVVSLAAALAIPVTLADGSNFPYRNLILFITFVVILLTLVVQGLTLPYLIKRSNLFDAMMKDESEEQTKQKMKNAAIILLSMRWRAASPMMRLNSRLWSIARCISHALAKTNITIVKMKTKYSHMYLSFITLVYITYRHKLITRGVK